MEDGRASLGQACAEKSWGFWEEVFERLFRVLSGSHYLFIKTLIINDLQGFSFLLVPIRVPISE
jgi:hypothetical protein